MAFFDDLGKKLSQAGQSTIQKTKEIAEVAKFNSMISDEEKAVNNNYYQIGKLYVSLHSSNYEKDFSGMIQSIYDSEEKIKDYRQQIQNIKGVVRCEKCGAEVPANVAFCSSCGAEMPKVTVEIKAADLVACEGCGQLVQKGMRFCTKCGHPMESIVPNVADTPTTEIKCPGCGSAVDADMDFCRECGTKL